MQIVNKHIKRCSTSPFIKEKQIKTIRKYNLTPVRIAIIQKSTINVGEDVEKREPSWTVGGKIS